MAGVILKVKGRLLGRGIWERLPLDHAWLGKNSVEQIVENGCSVCLCGAGKGSSLFCPCNWVSVPPMCLASGLARLALGGLPGKPLASSGDGAQKSG